MIDSFNVIPVGIENEGGVIARATQLRCAAIGSARSDRSTAKRVNLGPCFRGEGRVLLSRKVVGWAMRVQACLGRRWCHEMTGSFR
jgi:hypothetical protein